MGEYFISKDLEQFDSDFYLVRTPLLGIQEALCFVERLKDHSSDDIEDIMQFLSGLYDNDILMESIYIASPDLYAQFVRYKRKELRKSKSLNKLAEALIQYYLRACSRPTPFGLFAGCSMGGYAERSAIDLGSAENIKRSVRMDMDGLWLVIQSIMKNPAIFTRIKYAVNSSIYVVGKSYRYIEFILNEHKRRTHRIVSCERNNVLDSIYDMAKKGALYDEMMANVVCMGYDGGDAKAYLDELINSQFLVSELNINITGEDCFDRILKVLESRGLSDCPVTRPLLRLKALLQSIDTAPEKVRVYQAIFDVMREINPVISEKMVIQADMYRIPATCQLSDDIKEKVLSGISVLRSLNPAGRSLSTFHKFRKAFQERYENQLVSLAKVLDTEIGIGYRDALAEGADLQENLPAPSPYFDFKLNKYINWLQAGAKGPVIIEEADLQKYKHNELPMAVSFNSLVRLVSDGKPRLLMKTASGPSGGNLFARFAATKHLDLEGQIKKLYAKEESNEPEAIYAEIAHLPESRMGNVLARPHLREYEIPYLSYSTLEPSRQIPLEDLFIFYREGKLVLLSKRLNKEVIPRLSSAHNFRTGVPVYNFLADFQFQDIQAGCGWDWELLSGKMRLPRVEYKDVILFPETWSFNLALCKQHFNVSTPGEFELKFNVIRTALALPRFVLLAESDNELLLDLDNPYFIRLLKKKVAKGYPVRFIEFLDAEDHSTRIVKDNKGGMSCEINFSFYKRSDDTGKRPDIGYLAGEKPDTKVKRLFLPGSEWVYLKLYVARESADRILGQHIFPAIKRLKESGMVANWFFVRYSDPHFHIRLRLRLTNLKYYGQVLDGINRSIRIPISEGVVWNSVIDTYKREIERYGGKTMLYSEKMFDLDSDYCCEVIRKTLRSQDEAFRFMSALLMGMLLLDTFNYSPEEKEQFFESNFNGFAGEFNLAQNPALKGELSVQYRKYSGHFLELYRGPRSWIDSTARVKGFNYLPLSGYYQRAGILAGNMKESLKTEYSHGYLNSLLPSYIHMGINRLFPAHPREAELKVYSFLKRSMASVMARI